MRTTMAALAAVLVILGGAWGFRATGEAPPVDERLEPLAFIAGDWLSSMGGDTLHEHWSAPVGDTLMGSFRWMKPGLESDKPRMKAWIYEVLIIRAEEGRVVLYFRHFGNDMTSWEPKDEPIELVLDRSGDGVASFKNAREGMTPVRMTFEKTETGLRVTVGEGEDVFVVDYRPSSEVWPG